jgi:glycerophosphoryl diester phosphodiesterase
MIALKKSLVSIAVSMTLLAGSQVQADNMAEGVNGWTVSEPLFTVGETINGYTPPGVLDGLGAYKLNKDTVRVFANHELLNFRGYDYEVSDGNGGTFTLDGARISYFDIDKHSRQIVDSGLAYNKIYDANGNVATDISFLANDFAGFSRFCSSTLVEAGAFNPGPFKYAKPNRKDFGLEDTIYFTGEEDGGFFNSVGGAEWALDVENGELWQIPAMGRGAWENISAVDTGNKRQVAFILADDTSPFDFDNDGVSEAAPLFLYLGEKKRRGNFLERNGLADGQLYVWVSNTGETRPSDFNTSGSLKGRWVEVDNTPDLSQASEDGSTGYDEYGYPTQGNLWLQARDLGAFGFSRPEDVAYKPNNPSVVVLASTGVDTYDVDPATGNGVDTFGTMYTIKTNFNDLSAKISIMYDGDADPSRQLRSPDNLDWADNNRILIQEDEAEEDTLSGDEVLFGAGAKNPNEAGIVVMDTKTGASLRVANIDRSVILDASLADPTQAFDLDDGAAGEWESSGIIDVSSLFSEKAGTLFLFDVQAHGIEDQSTKSINGMGPNPNSRINDDDLVEGGQLLFLQASEK